MDLQLTICIVSVLLSLAILLVCLSIRNFSKRIDNLWEYIKKIEDLVYYPERF